MESETELENFLLKTCRICLCSGGKLRPLIVSSNEILDFIREVIGIEPELGDNLPQTICDDCENNVNGCLGFFDRCRSVDLYLRNLIVQTRSNEANYSSPSTTVVEGLQPCEQDTDALSEAKSGDIMFDAVNTNTEQEIVGADVKPEESVVISSVVEEVEEPQENIVEYEDVEEIELEQPQYEMEAQIIVKDEEDDKIEMKLEVAKEMILKSSGTLLRKATLLEIKDNEKKKRNHRKPTLCQVCGKILSGKVTFENHMRTHDDVKRYSCNVCEAKFWTRKNLLTHQQIHSGEKRYGCVVCGKMFRTYASCRYHQANHNKSLKEQPTFSCNVCEKTYKNKYNLLKHEKTHLDEAKHQEIYFKCDECGGNFKGRNAFSNHKKVHENKELGAQPKPFVCDVCGNKYRSKSNLYTHKQCHIMEQCPFCERTFSKTAFKTHLLTHTGGSNFECEICRKTYSQRYYLLKHMIRHKKNHFCDYCSETFVSKRALLDHQMNVCAGVGFQCEICGVSFEGRAELVEHIDQEHVLKK